MFILNENYGQNIDKQLFNILSVRVATDERILSNQQDFFARYVGQFRGKLLQSDDQAFIAGFEGASKAINCGYSLINAAKKMNAQLVLGVHGKVVIVDETNFISKETKFLIDSILEKAEPNKIMVTQIVKSLLSGAGFGFFREQYIIESRLGEVHRLYCVEDDLKEDTYLNTPYKIDLSRNYSFFENVLQHIYDHLDDELFNVEILCDKIGISIRQLQRKLKAFTIKSPIQLISSVRLHCAKELLLEKKYNIVEVSYKTGFSSTSYFSKCFKKEFGITPFVFLRKHR